MMYLIESAFNNNILFLTIIVILVILSVTVYLLYNQNKIIKEELLRKNKEISKEEPTPVVETPPKENEIEDLQSLTRELEMLPKEHTINMTQYEKEQEENAIISYEELLNESKINKTNEEPINLPREKNPQTDSYTHEEEVLKELKQLNSLLIKE